VIYRYITPSPPLQALVKQYLLIHFEFCAATPVPLKPFPARPEQSITFNFKGFNNWANPQTETWQNAPASAIFGQHTARFNLYPSGHYKLLRVFFQPGALYRLLGVPLSAFTDAWVDAEAVLGSEVRAVNERLANAQNYGQVIQMVEGYLLRKMQSVRLAAHPLDRVGQLLEADPTRFSLDWLSGQACLSPRQFDRRFNERMGVCPKLYSRIARYYQAFRYREAHPAADWLTVALRYGYSDVQHLNKDFRAFAGVTPNRLLEENSQSPENILHLTR
jgi:AraC-like DNA-binding protein